ncbi:MAG: hypothetical protein RLZZ450_4184 [Pseudomonadota bacterium]|jgi:uncharacterized protein (TIGR00255 family)
MTGFGAGEVTFASHPLRVELRSVNHRHLDVRVRVPSELGDVGSAVEDVVRVRCGRGRVEAQVSWRGTGGSASELDYERARRAYQLLLKLRDELAPGEPVPLSAVFSVPGVFSSRQWQRDELESSLVRATEAAASELNAMRVREGAALVADLSTRLGLLRSEGRAIETLRPQVLDAAQKRLTRRIEKLLEGTAIELDGARVAQEVAWFADKSDVTEELTRLSSHLDEFERSLAAQADSVGRKLDFLVQEIGRELNTLGSKANDADISRRVVDMKAELERIREQVQNIL